jgi:hypothetical protein
MMDSVFRGVLEFGGSHFEFMRCMGDERSVTTPILMRLKVWET